MIAQWSRKYEWFEAGSEQQGLIKEVADMQQRPLEFEVDDGVFLKISPTREIIRFGRCEKLSPQLI